MPSSRPLALPAPKTSRGTIELWKDAVAATSARLSGRSIEVNLVKATNHMLERPKEKHIQALLSKLRSAGSDDLTIEHQKLLDAIQRRLGGAGEWIIALKTQIVVHRALQDRAALLFARAVTTRAASLLEPMKSFLDRSKSEEVKDMSAFVRAHASYLQILAGVVTNQSFIKHGSAIYDSSGPLEHVDMQEILRILPELQKLQYTLVDSKNVPMELAGPGIRTYVMSLVVEDTLGLYSIITSGVSRLVDGFFDFDNVEEAEQAWRILTESVEQARKMEDFYYRLGVGAVSMATGGSDWRKPIDTRVACIRESSEKMEAHLNKLRAASPPSTPKDKQVKRKSTSSSLSREEDTPTRDASLATADSRPVSRTSSRSLNPAPSPRTPVEKLEAPFSTAMSSPNSLLEDEEEEKEEEEDAGAAATYDKGILELMTIAKQPSAVHPVSLI